MKQREDCKLLLRIKTAKEKTEGRVPNVLYKRSGRLTKGGKEAREDESSARQKKTDEKKEGGVMKTAK